MNNKYMLYVKGETKCIHRHLATAMVIFQNGKYAKLQNADNVEAGT